MENKVDYEKDTHKCTWHLGADMSKSPHIHEPFRPIPKKIYDDVLDAIGNTPMVRLNKVPQESGINCEVLAKCEFMNMGGSVKVNYFQFLCRTESENEWFLMRKRPEDFILGTKLLKLLQATPESVWPWQAQSEDTKLRSQCQRRCPLRRLTF